MQHPASAPSLPATSPFPAPIPISTSTTSSPPTTTTTSSYPLRDRSTLVRPERDLPEPPAASAEGGGGGRREKFLDQFLASVAPFPAQLHAKLTKMRELDEACVARMREMDECSKQHVHNIRHKWGTTGKHDNKPTEPTTTTAPSSSPSPSTTVTSTAPPPVGDSSAISPSTSEQSAVVAGPNAMSVKFGVGAAYDIEAAEMFLRAQRDELLRLSRAKQSLASDCYEGVDGHIRRLDVSLRKYETKLRKGTFDVTAQPVDRRKGSETQWDSEGRAMAAEVAAEMKTELERLEGGTGGGRRTKGKGEAGTAGGEGGKG